MRRKPQLASPEIKQRAVSYEQQKYQDEDQLPQIKKQNRPQSLLKNKQQVFNFSKWNAKTIVKGQESRQKNRVQDIDICLPSNNASLKALVMPETNHNESRSITKLEELADKSSQDCQERAQTPPRKSRMHKLVTQQELIMRSESFATLEVQDFRKNTIETNIIDFIRIHERMINILNCMKKNSNMDLIEMLNHYLQQTELQDYSQIEEQLSIHLKLVRQSIVMFKLAITVIINSFFDLHFYLANISNFKNILMYNLHNYYHLCELLIENRKQAHDLTQIPHLQQILTYHRKGISKIEAWTAIKQNIEMLQNLYKQLTKHQRDIYQFIITFIRTIPNIPIVDSMRNLQSYIAFYFTIQQSYQGLLGIPLICVAPTPYLPLQNSKGYTLVLDMDETLIHFTDSNQGGHFLVRPHAISFLAEMSNYYELVVFTAGLPDYANWVLDSIDKNHYIKYRLFRQHALQYKDMFIKDLSRLGRNLATCIIIDNVADNFSHQPENGIFIKAWYNDPHDTELLELSPMLRSTVINKVEDVRVPLRAYKNTNDQANVLPII